MKTEFDKIVFEPKDIDLRYSPVRSQLNIETYVLGAFNPGMTRLPNGNILLMVRVAESMSDPIKNETVNLITWKKKIGYQLDKIPRMELDTSDPRKYLFKNSFHKTYCLTSTSWLLPVEMNSSGRKVVTIHYDKIIMPEEKYQEYGIEDARLTKIEGLYYMTVCSVSSISQSTVLYSSKDGINYKLLGKIFDHQNKDVVIFPRKIKGYYYALTRPVGDHYFASNERVCQKVGPSICMAKSPDALHWKPLEDFIISPIRDSLISLKVGGSAPPFETEHGWLVLFHGVEKSNTIGRYRTFACLLDTHSPSIILSINYNIPILEHNSDLSYCSRNDKYLENVVFTSGIEEKSDSYILASGELDLTCRITEVKKYNIHEVLI